MYLYNILFSYDNLVDFNSKFNDSSKFLRYSNINKEIKKHDIIIIERKRKVSALYIIWRKTSLLLFTRKIRLKKSYMTQ